MNDQELAPFKEHVSRLSAQLGRQAFWKTALFGILLMERRWPVYERLSVGREWGAAKEIRKVLDRIWRSIPTGIRIGDSFWMMLEENPVQPVTKIWDPVAALVMEDYLYLMNVISKKKAPDGTVKKAAAELAERNLAALVQALPACGETWSPGHPLVQAELDFQEDLCGRLCAVPNSEKKGFVESCKEEGAGSILGDLWFAGYPDYKPVKRKPKKKDTRLRYTHRRYDEYVLDVKKQDEQGRDGWEREEQQLRLYDAWLCWSDRMPDDYSDPQLGNVAARWPMPEGLADIYNYLFLHFRSAAESCWACTEDPEAVRGMFWLSARAQEACYALLEKGWPCSEYLAYENSMNKWLTGPAYYAICAGDWDLAIHLLQRWSRPLTLRGTQAPWRLIPATKVWLALLRGEDERARDLIVRETQAIRPPDSNERLWPARYPWDGWDDACKVFQMLLDVDKKGLEKEIIHSIRSMRAQYAHCLETLAPYDLALWKLARRRGIGLDLPLVSEMPAALLEDRPLDGEKWKLPGQPMLDEALGPRGMELLERWRRQAKEER